MLPRILVTGFLVISFMSNALARGYEVGQVWSYRTRVGESDSTLLINRVEADSRFGKIFHISIFSLKLKNINSPEGFTSELPHIPVSEKSLDSSVLDVLRIAAPNPDHAAGYEEWRSQFEKGKAGVFDAEVADIIDGIESVTGK